MYKQFWGFGYQNRLFAGFFLAENSKLLIESEESAPFFPYLDNLFNL